MSRNSPSILHAHTHHYAKPAHAARRRAALLAGSAWLVGAVALSVPAVSAWASDDGFPKRPIKIIVGYSPGGTTDIVARVIAPAMGEILGQTVLVDNRPGAGGNLGSEATAKADPDGYTLMMGTAGSMTVNPWMYANLRFDTVRDFAPIANVASVSNVMVINPSIPAKTVAEFVAWTKARPDGVFFASSGTGNTPHMTGELFKLRTGLPMTHVPHKGSAPALMDLISGQGSHVMFDNLPSAIGHIRANTLRALATTGPTRASGLPNVPTMQEAGYKDFDVQGWFGLFAPKGTPAPVVDKLHTAVMKALARPEVRKGLEDLGAVVVGSDPATFAKQVQAETRNWGEVVKQANIKPN